MVSPAVPSAGKVVLAHCALATANAILGVGTVVSKLGLDGMNPVVFALLRELVAAPLLFMMSQVAERQQKQSDSVDVEALPAAEPPGFRKLLAKLR